MIKRLYCPHCDSNTKHDGEEQTPFLLRAMMRITTLGIGNCSSQNMYCTVCGQENYTYEPGLDRFTWARKGTGVYVDRGAYPGYHT